MSKEEEQVDIENQSSNVVYIHNPPVNLDNNLEIIYQLGNTIKLLTLIDLFFSIFMLFSGYKYSIIGGLLILMGYFGATNYNSCLTIGYMLYIIVEIIFRIWIIVTNPDIWIIILYSLFVVIEIWIFRLVYKFYQFVKNLSTEQKIQLKTTDLIFGYVFW